MHMYRTNSRLAIISILTVVGSHKLAKIHKAVNIRVMKGQDWGRLVRNGIIIGTWQKKA